MPELVNVPNVDGVPAVLFAPGAGGDIILAVADAIGLPTPFGLFGQEWGLFRGGRCVIDADLVAAFDHKAEWAVADYPLERGAFESYNKVKIPFDVRLVFAAGGSEASRSALLRSVEAIAGDLRLYDAVTPERVYRNVNVIHHDTRRSAQNGNGIVVVSLWCQEIRQVAQGNPAGEFPSALGTTGDTASASGASPTDGGTVQPDTATPGQAASANVGDQAFAGGYNLDASNGPGGYGTLGNSNFGIGTDFGNVSGTPPIADTGLGPVASGAQVTLPELSVTAPQTSSTISGLEAAGPDQYRTFGVSP